MEGINEKIQNEHEDYIQLKTRVDIAVELMWRDTYLNKESLLRVLGTEKAMELAEELRGEDQVRKAEEMERYSAIYSVATDA